MPVLYQFDCPNCGNSLSTWWLYGMYQCWNHVIHWSRREGLRPGFSRAGVAIASLFVPIANLFFGFRFYRIGVDPNAVIEERDLDEHVGLAQEDYGDIFLGLRLLAFGAYYGALNIGAGCLSLIGLALAMFLFLASNAVFLVFAHNLQRIVNTAGPILGGVPRRRD